MRLLQGILLATVSLLILTPNTQAADLSQDQFNSLMEKFLSDDANVAKIGDSLEGYFKKKREGQQKAAQEQAAKQLEEQFKNPVKVAIGNAPIKGPKDAKVTIIEFSDFQCPFCKRGMDSMDAVHKEYPKDVKIAFKHLPLPFHPEAKPAARASIAAQRQGKFWEMHDKLFENQKSLGEELYMSLAKEIGLDMAKFKKDFADPAVAKQVDDDAALATKLGVRGTPGFFVNGVQVKGAQPLPKFKELIDRWLAM